MKTLREKMLNEKHILPPPTQKIIVRWDIILTWNLKTSREFTFSKKKKSFISTFVFADV